MNEEEMTTRDWILLYDLLVRWHSSVENPRKNYKEENESSSSRVLLVCSSLFSHLLKLKKNMMQLCASFNEKFLIFFCLFFLWYFKNVAICRKLTSLFSCKKEFNFINNPEEEKNANMLLIISRLSDMDLISKRSAFMLESY